MHTFYLLVKKMHFLPFSFPYDLFFSKKFVWLYSFPEGGGGFETLYILEPILKILNGPYSAHACCSSALAFMASPGYFSMALLNSMSCIPYIVFRTTLTPPLRRGTSRRRCSGYTTTTGSTKILKIYTYICLFSRLV